MCGRAESPQVLRHYDMAVSWPPLGLLLGTAVVPPTRDLTVSTVSESVVKRHSCGLPFRRLGALL